MHHVSLHQSSFFGKNCHYYYIIIFIIIIIYKLFDWCNIPAKIKNIFLKKKKNSKWLDLYFSLII